MPRPKVRHAKSLLQTSLDVIAHMFVKISAKEKNDVQETCTNPIEGDGQSVLKCIPNPFEKLRKSHVSSCFLSNIIQMLICYFSLCLFGPDS